MKSMKKGFTLVELIIVIAVIGVLAAILIPVFANVIDKANAKSAYSDARNLTSQFVAEFTDNQTDLPDLVIFSVKGNKLYAFGYDADRGEVLVDSKNPYEYDENAPLADQATAIIGQLETDGALIDNPIAVLPEFGFNRTVLDRFITEYGFDPAELYIHADHLIAPMIFGEMTTQGGGNGGTPSTPAPETKQVTLTATVSAGTAPYGCNEYTFTIPAGTEADTTVILDTTAITNDLIAQGCHMPGALAAVNINIVDESGHNFSITDVEMDSELLMAYRIKSQQTALTDESKPSITKSDMFVAYMNEIGYSTVNSANTEEYIEKYNNGELSKTYAEYLTEQFGSLYNITMADIFSERDVESYGDFYSSDAAEHGIAAGNVIYSSTDSSKPLKHVEYEVIKLLLDSLYDYTTCYSFLSGGTQSDYDRYVNSIYYGSNGFWNYFLTGNGDWKTHFESAGMNFHSLIDMVERDTTPANLGFTKTGNTTSGAIMFTWNPGATNAYQATNIYGFPTMKIKMTSNG